MSEGGARVVVITGASSGIGAELARQLGRRGDALVLAARSAEALGEVARDAANALGAPPDVGLRTPAGMQPQTVEEATAAIVELLDHPRAEIYTNPASPDIARRYFEDVQAFEESARRAFGAAAPAPPA